MLSCHEDLQAAGGGQQLEWQEQAVPRGCQEETMGKRSHKQMRPLNSSLNQRGEDLPAWYQTYQSLQLAYELLWCEWFLGCYPYLDFSEAAL